MTKDKIGIFDKLINIFKKNIADIKDPRRQRSDIQYTFSDIILSSFSIFYFQNSSWLSFQRKMQTLQGSSNLETMFGVKNIPTDTHVKKILDKIAPKNFKKVYDDMLKYIESINILKQFVFMEKYLLVAFDGTSYHSSQKIKCDCCQTRTDKKTGITTFFHTAITPAIVHPKLKKAIALFQEFISNKDGDKKQDCEVNAAKRLLEKLNIFKKYKLIILGDDLYSRLPMIQKVIEMGHSFIFVCKEESHKFLYSQIESFKSVGSCKTFQTSQIHNGKKQIITYNWINGLLLNSSTKENVEVNWCEMIITDLNGKQIHCFSFVTDLEINKNNIEEIISAGRTRWKIENENNNILKTKGYHLEHNFGHGNENLSKNLCSLNILAFLFHTIQDFCDELYNELLKIIGTRKEFFQGISFITTLFNFKSFDDMLRWIILARTSDGNVDMKPYIVQMRT